MLPATSPHPAPPPPPQPSPRSTLITLITLATLASPPTPAHAAPSVFDWPQHDSSRPKPPVVRPASPSSQDHPGQAPSDAVVLFDGSSLAPWVALDGSPPRWIIQNGALECARNSGYIRTLQAFGDCQLHVEWAAPTPPSGSSQGRGNSGVFLMGLYEVQVLDSHHNVTYADGQAAAAYGQHPPLVNASLPPGHWQSYDIIFSRPRFDDRGNLTAPARLTVLHNGVLVQNNVELVGPTGWLKRDPYRPHPDKLPLALQDHGNPVRYRNIWIRELGADAQYPEFVFDAAFLSKLTGTYRADDGMTITIAKPDPLLTATISYPGRSMVFPLHAESSTAFRTRGLDGRFTFRTSPDGTPDALVFRVGGDERVVRRNP